MTLTLLGTTWRESEFVGGLTGACGPNALAMAASWSRQRYVSTLDVYNLMHAHGLCDANGVSNIGKLHDAVPLLGLPLAAYRAYGEPWPDWKAWFTAQLAASRMVLWEASNGQALRDARTGLGENASHLQYHFLDASGYDPATGLWTCLDGDNYAVGNVAQHYSDATMSAAAPCAALAIGRIANPVTIDPYVPAPDHAGWYKDSRTGCEVGGGIHAYALAHSLPPCIQGETVAPNGRDSYAVFGDPKRANLGDHLVYWDASHNAACEGWQGATMALQAEVDALKRQLAAASGSADAAMHTDMRQIAALADKYK